VEDSSDEAGGDEETHDKPSPKEARSKKKHDCVEEKWMVVPIRQVVTIKLLTGPAPRRRDLRKSTVVVEKKWMMAPMKMMVDLQCILLLLMMMPHCEGNNLFFSPTWVARATTRRILLVLVL
jgi:hypothetical protein